MGENGHRGGAAHLNESLAVIEVPGLSKNIFANILIGYIGMTGEKRTETRMGC